MKGQTDAGDFEKRPRLFANLDPFLIGFAVAPLVQEMPTRCQYPVRLRENRTPVRRDVQKPGDNDNVHTTLWKREARALTSDDSDLRSLRLGSQRLHHPPSRLDRNDLASELGERDGYPTSTRADIENPDAGAQCNSDRKTSNFVFRQESPVPAIIHSRVSGKVNTVVHGMHHRG
jgi:hypothetical protein